MQLQSPSDVVPLSSCWPLSRELSLPKTLIGPDYLEEVFFRVLPAQFNCSATAIRKALKLFLKRAAREAYDTLPSGSGISDRDRELAALACNDPRARERIREIEITVEVGFSRFGRQRIGYRDKTVDLPLPKLLWLGYAKNPAYNEFVDWTKRIGVQRPDISIDGYYITSQALERALTNESSLPLAIGSVEFARALILFGALLPPAEALDLFITASRFGCNPLRVLLEVGSEAKPDLSTTGVTPTSSAALQLEKISAIESPPRLGRREDITLDAEPSIAASPDVEQLVSQLIESDRLSREAESRASELFKTGVKPLVDASEHDFTKNISLLEAVRTARHIAQECRRICHEKSKELTRQAYAIIGTDSPHSQGDGPDDIATISRQLRDSDELKQLASGFDLSMANS
jgi:hypothetical protein